MQTAKHIPPFSEALAVVTLVFTFSLAFLFLNRWTLVPLAVVIVLTALAWFRNWYTAFPLGLFAAVCLTLVAIGLPFSQVWLGIGLVAYLAVSKNIPQLNNNLCWLRVGGLNRQVFALILGSCALAATALIIWFLALRPNIDDLIETFLPNWGMGYLIIGGLLFSMLNALVEEGAYRGVIMQALEETLGPGLALVLQAASFGLLHIHGFPRGWSGVFLAGIFGVLMGLVREKAEGMLAPWLAHLCVDIVIVSIVIIFAHAT